MRRNKLAYMLTVCFRKLAGEWRIHSSPSPGKIWLWKRQRCTTLMMALQVRDKTTARHTDSILQLLRHPRFVGPPVLELT